MGRVWRFVVPVDPHALSLNQRLHWRERARITRAHREQGFYAWWSEGKPRCAGRVRVSLHVRRLRVIDADAVRTGAKALLDGLLVGLPTTLFPEPSLLGDDSPARVEEGAITWETGKTWRLRPQVVVTVEELQCD